MASVIIPVLLSFFLGPGIGQLYNKDYKKGLILILLSIIVLIIGGLWFLKALKPYLPNDLAGTDPQALQPIIRNAVAQVSAAQGYILSAFQGLLSVLWIYGMVDAYRVAQSKRTSGE